MTTDCQTWARPQTPSAFALPRESKLKLNLEQQNRGDVTIVHCQGRIVYRDEAAAFSRLFAEVLPRAHKLVLDLSGVTSMDSAGIGELAQLLRRAQSRSVSLRCASPTPLVRHLLDLTNLDSVLKIHASLEDALESFRETEVCADC
jgi:anti-sigma B factor antagonist